MIIFYNQISIFRGIRAKSTFWTKRPFYCSSILRSICSPTYVFFIYFTNFQSIRETKLSALSYKLTTKYNERWIKTQFQDQMYRFVSFWSTVFIWVMRSWKPNGNEKFWFIFHCSIFTSLNHIEIYYVQVGTNF